jgi:hypothetical protein
MKLCEPRSLAAQIKECQPPLAAVDGQQLDSPVVVTPAGAPFPPSRSTGFPGMLAYAERPRVLGSVAGIHGKLNGAATRAFWPRRDP